MDFCGHFTRVPVPHRRAPSQHARGPSPPLARIHPHTHTPLSPSWRASTLTRPVTTSARTYPYTPHTPPRTRPHSHAPRHLRCAPIQTPHAPSLCKRFHTQAPRHYTRAYPSLHARATSPHAHAPSPHARTPSPPARASTLTHTRYPQHIPTAAGDYDTSICPYDSVVGV